MRRITLSWMIGLSLALLPATAWSQGEQPYSIHVGYAHAAQELYDESVALTRANRHADAADRLQRILNEYPYRMLQADDGLFIDARLRVHQRLLSDEQLLSVYRRVHEPSARRMLDQAVNQRIDATRLSDIRDRFGLTRAGLEATLMLAGLYLEQANAGVAGLLLDDAANHPDLKTDADMQTRHAQLLQATTHIHRHWRQIAERRDRSDLIEPLPLDAPTLEQALEEPLWRLPLSVDLSRQPVPGAARTQQQSDVARTATAGVAGEQVLLHEGGVIRALDRTSQRLLWEYRLRDTDDATLNRLRTRAAQLGMDTEQREVAVAGQRIAAVLGFTGRGVGDVHGPQLVCLNRHDGTEHWAYVPGDLDPALARGVFQGTPITEMGRVYATVSIMQANSQLDVHLVAVDMADGELIWQRHVASIVVGRSSSVGPAPRLLTGDGMIYLSNDLGVIAGIDMNSGAVRWTRLVPALRPDRRVVTMPGATGSGANLTRRPAITDQGLLVPVQDDGLAVLLLEPRSGRILREMREEPWDDTRHLYATGNHLLIIGRKVTCIDLQTWEPRWSLAMPGTVTDAPSGFVDVEGDYLALTTRSRLMVVNINDGSVIAQNRQEEAFKVALRDGQLIVCGANYVASYLPWPHAEARLTAQMKAYPDDPGPGLALAQLALQSHHQQQAAALLGIDHALGIARKQHGDQQQNTQQHLFEQLRWFVQMAEHHDADFRRALFDRLAGATTNASQQVAYHLLIGPFMEQIGQHAKAVDHYQTILLDSTLARQLFQSDTLTRQASLEARMRLQTLVEKHGRQIYARYDALAEQRLAELTARDQPPLDALLALTEHYPLARIVPQVLWTSATRYLEIDQPAEAADLLRQVYLQSEDNAMLAAAVGRLATLYAQAEQPRRAMLWLQRLKREHPDVQPLRNGEPVSVDQWLTDLAAMPDALPRLPVLSLPLGQPRVIEGRVLAMPDTIREETQSDVPIDYFLTMHNQNLRLHALPDARIVWEYPAPASDVRIIAANDEQIMLFSPSQRTIAALNTRNGEPHWPILELDDELNKAGEVLADQDDQQQDREIVAVIEGGRLMVRRGGRVVIEEQQDADRSNMQWVVDDMLICLADQHGRVLGIDRLDGTVRWRSRVAVRELTGMAISDQHLVLAGAASQPSIAGQPDAHGLIVALNPQTGDALLPPIRTAHPPRWIGMPGDDLLIVAANAGREHASAGQPLISAYDLNSGAIAWESTAAALYQPQQAWAAHGLLVLRDLPGTIQWIDARDGRVLNQTSGGMLFRGDQTDIQLQHVNGTWHLMTAATVTTFDGDGSILWRDAIHHDEKELASQLASRDHLVLINATPEGIDTRQRQLMQRQAARPQPAIIDELQQRLAQEANRAIFGADNRQPRQFSQHLFILDRHSGMILAEHRIHDLTIPIDAQTAIMLDNAMILSMGDLTMFIPGDEQQNN